MKTPYKDYAGVQLYTGDIVRHPDWQQGVVYYDYRYSNKWRVQYDDGSTGALALQIGHKGRAVKVGHDNS